MGQGKRMEKDIDTINEELRAFWNEAMALTNEEKEEALSSAPKPYEELAPSRKLFDAVKGLAGYDKVLDYGCGSGWASIVLAKSGCKDVLAVDLGEEIIKTLRFNAKLYGVENNIHATPISSDWLANLPSDSFDALVCSNVLDVIPLETGEAIIAQFARILKKGGRAVIGLNFYMSPEMAKERNVELVDGHYLFSNGVLRLTSLPDERWTERFLSHFKVESLSYFAWPGEKKESRRLFVLGKE